MRKAVLPLLFVCLPGLMNRAQEKAPKLRLERIRSGGEQAEIFRDDYGVPRVFAKSRHALFVGDGYAVAEDRAWQMEKYRLDAEGRLAEVFGKKMLDHDKEVRRDGMSREEWRKEFQSLPPDIQDMLRAYAEGVNLYYHEAARTGRLSPEFGKNNWQPAPWTVEDTMAIAGMMGRRFGASGTDQLRNTAVVEFLTKRLGSREEALKVFNDLAWTNDPAAISTVAAEDEKNAGTVSSSLQALRERSKFDAERMAGKRRDDPSLLMRLQAEADGADTYKAARQLGLATKWGSYCWMVAPAKSVSGAAMLVGGPQMGFATPQIAHEVQLTGAGFNVMGMGFAGIPGVLIGSNDHLAWTSTSGASHNEDLFAERLKPGDPHQYFYRGAWRAMERRVEMIRVKSQPAVRYEIYRTVHGPVTAWSLADGLAYSKQMAYFGKEYETTVAFLGLNMAKSIRDIPPLAAKIASSHNIFVATDEGDIAFWHGGFFPVYAPDSDPRFPLRGTGEDDWRGIVPFEAIPQVVNPSNGLIFNWNNKPAPDWKNYSVPAWGAAFRISNIRNALEARLRANDGKLSYTEFQSIAPLIGRHNYIADWLKPGLLEAAGRKTSSMDDDERQAIEYLRHWDNQVREGSVAQTIFDAWYQRLRHDIFDPVVGDLGSKDNFDDFVNEDSVLHVLAGSQSSVPPSRDYLGGRSADDVRLESLRQALAGLRKDKGPDMRGWGYHFDWIKFDPLRPIPWYSRGTYIQTVELGRPRVHGDWILPPGENEDSHSSHFGDQLLLASWWMYAPMQLMTETEAEAAVAEERKAAASKTNKAPRAKD